VLVRDEHDRALLGRQARWEKGWFSTLAGFVEPGESAEDAVRREVAEESGVRVGEVVFLGSQPWPFPSSLMFGYHAWATDPSIEVDGTEIEEARWFSRDELAAACREGSVSLPPAVSIARRLIERWYGDELPGDWSRPIQVPR
jgi:NAD+ diphosphatase